MYHRSICSRIIQKNEELRQLTSKLKKTFREVVPSAVQLRVDVIFVTGERGVLAAKCKELALEV